MMYPQFKPMLSGIADVGKLRLPVLASPKIDGFRCIILDGVAMSRSLKPIPNPHVQELFGRPEFEGFDGELTVGPANASDVIQRTAEVMRLAGEPDVYFHVFDVLDPMSAATTMFAHRSTHYASRINDLRHRPGDAVWHNAMRRISAVHQTHISSYGELEAYEARAIQHGFEGVMLRSLNGGYKFGRSTTKEGTLLKLKRFEDSEATIMAIEPAMHNANVAKRNAVGALERSSAKDGKVAMEMIGRIQVYDKQGREFWIAPGTMDHNTRRALWLVKETLIGQIVKYKHFPHGEKDVPRHGSFLAFRHPDDT